MGLSVGWLASPPDPDGAGRRLAELEPREAKASGHGQLERLAWPGGGRGSRQVGAGLVPACAAGHELGLVAKGRATVREEAGAEGRQELLLWEATWRYLAARRGSRLGTRARQGR